MNNKKTNRIILHRKDIEQLTGYKEKTARAIMNAIRTFFGKKKRQPITVREFCIYMKEDPGSIQNGID